MSFWREPEPPPVQRMPKKRETSRGKSYLGRLVALVAGVALLVSGGLGLYRNLSGGGGAAAGPGGGSPFMSLAVLLPASILLRYAATGQIKGNN